MEVVCNRLFWGWPACFTLPLLKAASNMDLNELGAKQFSLKTGKITLCSFVIYEHLLLNYSRVIPKPSNVHLSSCASFTKHTLC